MLPVYAATNVNICHNNNSSQFSKINSCLEPRLKQTKTTKDYTSERLTIKKKPFLDPFLKQTQNWTIQKKKKKRKPTKND